ncbi:hypothetical protein [Acetobacter persici]|uniref:hypothetical protein n=1 Tax=Acetobacter persici TaxID=1076596 RepID=UPI0039EBED23
MKVRPRKRDAGLIVAVIICGEINFSGINSLKKKIPSVFIEKLPYFLAVSGYVLH